MDSERVKSMLLRVYILYEEALPSNLKGAKITANVQRFIKVGSSSGLILFSRATLNCMN